MEMSNIERNIIQKDIYRYVPSKFIEVAESLETQFINHMLKQMQATTGEKIESTAESYYKDLQTSERSKLMSQTSNSGSLKDLILNQIYPKKFRNELTYNTILKQQQAKTLYNDQIKIKE